MKSKRFSGPSTGGFTLLELIVVISIITLLAGLLTPIVKGTLDDAKVAKVTNLYDTLKKASTKYWYDTDSFAVEDDDPAVNKHDLMAAGGVTKWKGPYLDSALTPAVNPWGGKIRLENATSGEKGATNGYTLPGSIAVGSTIEGGQLVIEDVPDILAQKIDEAIDGAAFVLGTTNLKGICEFADPAATGGKTTLYIYLFHKQ